MSQSYDNCKDVSPECPVEASLYGYAPNLGANVFYAIIFAVCALIQLYFTCRYWKLWKGFSILVCVGCVLESAGYIVRLLLSKNPWNGAALSIQFLLLMVAPSLLAAAMYMTLRTLVQYFGPEHTRLPARFWTWPFVTADIIGFFLQCGGGILSSLGGNLANIGTIIMVFGVSFQAVIMGIAGALAADFALRIRRRHGTRMFRHLSKNLRLFLWSMTAAFFLILGRCIYR